MQISIASAPGSATKDNEDWFGALPGVFVVLDGVSAPAGTDTGCVHGTPWFVRRLGGELLTLAAGHLDWPLKSALAGAIRRVRRAHADTCDLGHPGSPAATVVMLRHLPDKGVYDYLVLADSTLILELDDGVKVVSDSRADAVVPDLRDEAFRHALGSHQQKVALAAMVDAQRELRNTSGGYWVASADPHAADHALTGSVHDSRFGSAALVTDGVTRQVEWGLAEPEDLLAEARRHGAQWLIDRVRTVESGDPTGVHFPRYSPSDDATAVVVVGDTPGGGR